MVEIDELDEGLEDTRCMGCGRRASACNCYEQTRETAARQAETQAAARIAGALPLPSLVGVLRRVTGRRPWWATPEGRRRVGDWLRSLRR